VKGKIELRRVERIPRLSDLVAQITPENRYPEIPSGSDVGREEVVHLGLLLGIR
jgi:antitoxin component of MazEF toxin-antitoxin module